MAISEITNISMKDTEEGGGDKQEEEDEKPRTLFVGNVPREVHKREIEEIFGDIGPLKRCYIQFPRDGNEKRKQREDTTVAYVTFALSQDAAKAMETLQSTKIGDNKINIKFAKARSEQVRQSFGDGYRGRPQRNANFEPLGGVVPEKPKEPRPKPVKKKSRLIVRNLSFKVTDEKMKEYFQKCGDVKEVNILKKSNGKLVGCAFIQYQNIYQAANAIKELNMKPFLGRPIAIDWALPKEKYQTEDEKQQTKNGKDADDETIEIKDEPEDLEESNELKMPDHYEHLKEESMDMEVDVEEIKEEDSESKYKAKKASKRKPMAEDDDDILDAKDEPKKKQKRISNDVEEGKTLFLRNLSFDTKEDDLKQFFEKFGELHYALLCKDSLTEHPKGTGFVKFKFKSSADDCLQQYESDSSEFRVSGRQFNVSVALSKDKISNISTATNTNTNMEKKSTVIKPKADSRNLYLVREGFIRPGSAAALDVSAADMNKRASLNKVKKQMLKNLNILISPTRICVHNLPVKFTDQELRSLFAKHGGSGAKITEARIMRDMNDIGLNGKGKSKGFGFVNFTDHENALTALRTVNNNPSIFTQSHRPIVEFSMENRLALKAKEKRALKSKEKNTNQKMKKNRKESRKESNNDDGQDIEAESNSKRSKKEKRNKQKVEIAEDEEVDEDESVSKSSTTKQKKKNMKKKESPAEDVDAEDTPKKPAKKGKKKNMKKKDSLVEEVDAEDTPKKSTKKGKKKMREAEVDEKDENTGNNEKVVPKYAGLKGKKGVQSVPSFKPKGKITRNSLKPQRSKKKKLQERKQREAKVPSKRPLDKPDKTEKMISQYKQKLHQSNDTRKKKKWFD